MASRVLTRQMRLVDSRYQAVPIPRQVAPRIQKKKKKKNPTRTQKKSVTDYRLHGVRSWITM